LHVMCMLAYSNIRKISPSIKMHGGIMRIYCHILSYTSISRHMTVYYGICRYGIETVLCSISLAGTTSGRISYMTSGMIYLFSMPCLSHLLHSTPALQGGSTLCLGFLNSLLPHGHRVCHRELLGEVLP
jgi:hypothetical protein